MAYKDEEHEMTMRILRKIEGRVDEHLHVEQKSTEFSFLKILNEIN